MTRKNWKPNPREHEQILKMWDGSKTARQLAIFLGLKLWQIYALCRQYPALTYRREIAPTISDSEIRRQWHRKWTLKKNALYFGFSLTWAYQVKKRLGLVCAGRVGEVTLRKLSMTGKRGFQLGLPASWMERKGWQAGDDLKLTNESRKITIQKAGLKKVKKTA